MSNGHTAQVLGISKPPDLNPIENLLSILNHNVRDRRPQSKAELFRELQDGWNKLYWNLLRRLVDSMPRRIQALLDNNGWPASTNVEVCTYNLIFCRIAIDLLTFYAACIYFFLNHEKNSTTSVTLRECNSKYMRNQIHK